MSSPQRPPRARVGDCRLFGVAIVCWLSMWAGCRGIVDPAQMPTFLMNITLGACALSGLLIVHWRHRRYQGRHMSQQIPSLRLSVAVLVGTSAITLNVGSVAYWKAREDPLSAVPSGTAVHVDAVLTSDPAPLPWGSGWSASARSTALIDEAGATWVSDCVLRLRDSGHERYFRGDHLRMSGTLDRSDATNAHHIGTLDVTHLELRARPQGVGAIARSVVLALESAIVGVEPDAGAIIVGMSVGNTALMSSEMKTTMRNSSLAHLTAVSGMHLSILIGCLTALVPRRYLKLSAIVMTTVVLLLVVGPQPSLVRASAMTSMTLVAMAMRRHGQPLASLSAVTIGILLLDPWASHSWGFALSVVATWAVIGPARRLSACVMSLLQSAHPRDSPRLKRVGRAFARQMPLPARGSRWAEPLVSVAAISLCAQCATGPLIVMMSGRFPLWGMIANVLAAPAVAPATLLCVLAAALAVPFPGVAAACAHAASYFTQWIVTVAHAVSSLPASTIEVPGGGITMGAVLVVGGVTWCLQRIRSAAVRIT